MKRTLIILLDSLIFAGVLPGCGTALTTIADMTGPELSLGGGFLTIVPSIAERDLEQYPITVEPEQQAGQAEQPSFEPASGEPSQDPAGDPVTAEPGPGAVSAGPPELSAAPALAPPAKPGTTASLLGGISSSQTAGFAALSALQEPILAPEAEMQDEVTAPGGPRWDVPILAAPKKVSGPVEKSVASPYSAADATVAELVSKLNIPKPKKITVYHPASDSSGLVAIYAMNLREVLVVDPLDPEGRVDPGAMVLFEELLRSSKTGAAHEVDPALVRLLYAVALAHDRVLIVSSGYREPGGGTHKTSYHTQGMAADLKHPYLPAKSIVDFAREWGAGGVGYYPKTKFVHLDVRSVPYYWVDYSGSGETGQVLADWEGHLADEAAAIWEPEIPDDEPADDALEDAD